IERSSEAEGDFANGSADETFRGARNVPGEAEFFCENIRRATGEKSERNAVAILLTREAVDNFVERAVATASDHELAAFPAGAEGDFRSVAGAGSFGKFRFDAASCQNAACLVELFATRTAAAARIRVVDQECVAKFGGSFH